MKIKYKTGNLLECIEQCLLQGVNSMGAMNSGVAKAIRAKYPEVYREYKKTAETVGLHLGDVIWVATNDKLIANGVTQEFYGYDDKTYIDYNAINKVMEQVHQQASTEGFSVAMPQIGAGLGGGDWKKIETIIEETCSQPVTVYLFK